MDTLNEWNSNNVDPQLSVGQKKQNSMKDHKD